MLAAVAPSAGERESEAPLGESESTMVGVTAIARQSMRAVVASLLLRGRDVAPSLSHPRRRYLLRPHAFSLSIRRLLPSVARHDGTLLIPSYSFLRHSSPSLSLSHARARVPRCTYALRARFTFRTRPVDRPNSEYNSRLLRVCVYVWCVYAIRSSPGEFRREIIRR